jgi:hypothetical protein
VKADPTDLLPHGRGSVPVLRFRSLRELIVSVGVSVRQTKGTTVFQFQNKTYMGVDSRCWAIHVFEDRHTDDQPRASET